METHQLWRSRPVFISSPFRDMHAERDYLHNFVFSELAEKLRVRRHHLEPIDLRWGIETISTDEVYAKELLVLKVCLSEIERSRPYMLVLLGDRYGWIPPADRMKAATDEAGFRTAAEGKSITELEIEFGILNSPDQKTRADIFTLETDAKLVVLYACNTAGGEISQGYELVGMSRAFMYAGSPVAVASLWKVSDASTAKLMSYFYSEIKKGNSAGQAMREAQLKLMKEYPNPN